MPHYIIKIFVSFLLILLTSGVLFAQTKAEKERIKKSKIHSLTIIKYNYIDDNIDTIAAIEATMTFDNIGNVTEYIYSTGDTSGFTLSSIYENDRIISSKNTRNGKLQDFTAYKYDEKSLLTEETMIILYDKPEQNDTIITRYQYNRNGSIKLSRMTSAFTKDFGPSVTEYFYDKNGNLNKEIRKDDEGAVEMSKISLYDKDNNLIDYILTSGYKFFLHSSFKYDAQGRTIEKADYSEKGALLYRTEYTNDENGNPLTTVYYDKDNEKSVFRKYVYTFY